ncbi:MAG TPA: hypothetical protein VIH57_17810 [Bacteroidales bacterium]
MLKDDGKYLHLWMKYAAAIRILVKKTDVESQKLQLYKHEIDNYSPKANSGHLFSFELINGKAINSSKNPAIARDLVQVLESNTITKNLIKERALKVSMDKSFELLLEKI